MRKILIYLRCFFVGHKPVYSIVDDKHIVAVCKDCKKVLLYHTIEKDVRAGCFFRRDK